MKHDPGRGGAAEAIRDGARALGIELDSGAPDALAAFEGLLAERAVPLGMIGPSDAPRLRERHVLDCLRAVLVVRADDRLGLDLGSGAGLPGLVVAIARPDLSVRLIEPRRARAAFLELAIERLKVTNASVLPLRVEDVDGLADLCFARAFAPLPASWGAARRLLRVGGRFVYFAGAEDANVQASAFPEDASAVQVLETPLLASSGPLVIMTR